MRHYLIIKNPDAEFRDQKFSKVTVLIKEDYQAICNGWVDAINPDNNQLFEDENDYIWLDMK